LKHRCAAGRDAVEAVLEGVDLVGVIAISARNVTVCMNRINSAMPYHLTRVTNRNVFHGLQGGPGAHFDDRGDTITPVEQGVSTGIAPCFSGEQATIQARGRGRVYRGNSQSFE
jgi:hypothetical protein